MKNLSYPLSRSAFTLVELLVAITVIALLVGMLAFGIFPALNRSKEAAIQTEMVQIEQSIEHFKNKFGFYPPSFESDATYGISSAAELLSYVNRMSPNHAESTPSGHGTETRLQHWSEQVGRHLDQESSLVFWLSGTCKNKQFPITGGSTLSPPLAAHSFFPGDTIERDVIFDFKASQLYGDVLDEVVYTNKDQSAPDNMVYSIGAASPIPVALQATATTPGYILEYSQGHGRQDGDLLYKYRDAGVYPLACYASKLLPTVPLNPQSFQLITFGLDGRTDSAVGPAIDVFNAVGAQSVDNICNFAGGRLDKYINENSN